MFQSKCEIDHESISPEQDFYKEAYPLLEGAITSVLSLLDGMQNDKITIGDKNPIEHYKARIKSAESMKEKLIRKKLPITVESALHEIHDAAGVRVVCTFLDDIYWVANMIKKQVDVVIVDEKDYIHNPKPNGYRSYHMILQIPVQLENKIYFIYLELQIRTIAMDCWASLEHHMKYKKNIHNQDMITGELKRCADEIASTDLNLQTIWDMIKDIDHLDDEKKVETSFQPS